MRILRWEEIGSNPLYRRGPRVSLRAAGMAAVVGLAVVWLAYRDMPSLRTFVGMRMAYAALPILAAVLAARHVARDRERGFWDDVTLTRLTAAQILLGNLVAVLRLPGTGLVGLMALNVCLIAVGDPLSSWSKLLWAGAATACALVTAALIGVWCGLRCRRGPQAAVFAMLLVLLFRFALAVNFAPESRWVNYVLMDTGLRPLHLGTLLTGGALSAVLWVRLVGSIRGGESTAVRSTGRWVQILALPVVLAVGYVGSWRPLRFDDTVWRSTSVAAARGCWTYLPPGDNRRARMLDDMARRSLSPGRVRAVLGSPDLQVGDTPYYRLMHEPRLDHRLATWVRWGTAHPYLRVRTEESGGAVSIEVVERSGSP